MCILHIHHLMMITADDIIVPEYNSNNNHLHGYHPPLLGSVASYVWL